MNSPNYAINKKYESGPPRQATGPPRSGAGVGVGILKGVVVFWKSERFKNMIVQKCQDSTPVKISPKVLAIFRNSLKNQNYLRLFSAN